MNGIDKLAEAIRTDKSTQPYDTRAEVVRISGSTAYVHIPGGVAETPVTMTISCKKGDTVQVRVSGGRAWIVGNETAPPTDDTKVKEVEAQTELMKKRLTGVEGQYSEFIRTSEYIRSVVSDGNRLVSIINQTADAVQISANKINLNGYVTVASLESTDTTTINGGAIQANSFSAKYRNSSDSADVQLNANGLAVWHKYNGYTYRSDIKPGEIITQSNTGSSTLAGSSLSIWNSAVTNGATVGPNNVKVETADTYARMYGSSFECNHSTTGRTGRFVSSAAGNIGLYDASEGNYIIYSGTDLNVHIPHPTSLTSVETYNGYYKPVGSYGTDGRRVAYMSARLDSSNYQFRVAGQWGDTGDNFSTKTIWSSSVSDIRLKQNIENTNVSGLDAVNQMQLRQFDWIRDGKHQPIGFIADELETIDPDLALGGGYDEDGNIDEKQVNTYMVVAYLTKAVQELSAKVEELEERLSTMEENCHGHS